MMFRTIVYMFVLFFLFFFFKQKTAYEMRISDWSSDVCSSDLLHRQKQLREEALLRSLENRQRCRLGTGVERRPGLGVDDPRGFQRFAQVGVDDRPGVSIGIIDRDLILGQAMLKDIILTTARKSAV